MSPWSLQSAADRRPGSRTLKPTFGSGTPRTPGPLYRTRLYLEPEADYWGPRGRVLVASAEFVSLLEAKGSEPVPRPGLCHLLILKGPTVWRDLQEPESRGPLIFGRPQDCRPSPSSAKDVRTDSWTPTTRGEYLAPPHPRRMEVADQVTPPPVGPVPRGFRRHVQALPLAHHSGLHGPAALGPPQPDVVRLAPPRPRVVRPSPPLSRQVRRSWVECVCGRR